MREKTKSTKLSRQRHLYIKATCIGVTLGLLSYIVILLIFAFVFTLQDMPQFAMNAISIIALVVGSFLAGYIICKITHRNGVPLGLTGGGLLFAVIFIVNLIVNYGHAFTGLIFTKLFIVLLSSAIGGILGANSKRKRT